MDVTNKPLLSIGMIFKNEIRCLERCMKSLEPLRKEIPCELIMVDTGSEDGSREIAERYADTLVDFPWINDFAAARNEAMDRASGTWYLSIDADEWLDEDVSGLVRFLKTDKKHQAGLLVVRNYTTESLEEYSDGHLVRLLRMSTGLRFRGAIHEAWYLGNLKRMMLHKSLLHHDGYVNLLGEQGAKKRERNRSIMQAELEKDPKNLRLLMSYIDCSRYEEDGPDYILKACALVEEKHPQWELFGPPIFRYAVFHADEKELPELDAWVDRAVEWFPNSFFTTIDVAQAAFFTAWKKENYAACLRWGEMYLKAIDDLNSGKGDQNGIQYGTLLMATPRIINSVLLFTAVSYMKEKNPGRTLELLEKANVSGFSHVHASNLATLLRELHETSEVDTAPLVSRLYDELCRPTPTEGKRDERRAAFIQKASAGFNPAVQKSELLEINFRRPSYQVFLPLADRCDLGRGAAILAAENSGDAAAFLSQVESWDELPILSLEHALDLGVAFPPENKSLTLEEMDVLAGRLARKDGPIVDLTIRAVDNVTENNWQAVIWARELALAAIQSDCWPETNRGMELCRAFVKIEGETLPRYYGAEALREENIPALPPMHRFGWYCVRAFEALDAGVYQDYLRLLRAGLAACPSMKGIVEFLASNTPELQEKMDPSPELRALADQVRTLLASFAPGDPSLDAIRSSEAYQKVAYLIEGMDAGGLPS